MKIFFDHQIFELQQFGGISRYFNEVMKIEDQGVEVEKLDLASESVIYKQPTDLISRGKNYLKRKTGLGKLPVQEDIALRIKRKINDTQFNIFHPTYYDPYFLEYVNKPFVLTVYDMIHEIYSEYFSFSDPTAHNKKVLCEKAAAIIAISENTKRDIVDILGISPEKVHAIPLASDFDKVIPVQPAASEDIKNFILFVGHRSGYKNFYFPVTAIASLLKQDQHLQLLCTGLAFNRDEEIFFNDLGIRHQVKHIFLKNDQELAWAYQHAELFIFPSLYEGFGFPVLEAFAKGCPVIASNGGSLQEVGGDGALYFNPKNIKEIREVAGQVLYNKALKKELVEKGTAVFKKFSWEKCRQQTLEVYRSL